MHSVCFGAVVVLGLSPLMTKDRLWMHFSDYGQVKAVRMPLSRETGAVLGLARIEFEAAGIAAAKSPAVMAARKSNGRRLGDNVIRVELDFQGNFVVSLQV